MRRAVLVGSLAVTAVALAKPPETHELPKWGDWVGEYTGKLAWSSCTAEGEGSATLAVDASDGQVAIDLTPAGGSLEPITLLEDNGAWIGQHGDVSVHLAHPRPDTLDLAIDLDSGCQVRSSLKRASTGIASCDRLAGWARIEQRCTKLTKPPLENQSRLAHQRATWLAAKGDARTKLAAQCDARAQKVELELVDAGCAPNPDPTIGLRAAECTALRVSASKLSRCRNLPPDVEIALEQEASGLVSAAQSADSAVLHEVETECRALRARIVAASQQSGCIP
ncbi:MAG: hypothetical protein JO257_28890 [Deltaproteobacteria bacterium]|nr:hypothetical protein [Deltaproteobacteria bacterium]